MTLDYIDPLGAMKIKEKADVSDKEAWDEWNEMSDAARMLSWFNLRTSFDAKERELAAMKTAFDATYTGAQDWMQRAITAEAELAACRAACERKDGLLRVAECPNHCIDGAITWDRGGECEQEQCQFCYERDAALKEQP